MASPISIPTHPPWSREEEALIQALRGKPIGWPENEETTFGTRLLEEGRRHGVLSLLRHRFHGTQEWEKWPKGIRDRLLSEKEESVLDLVREWELRQVLSSLARKGIHPLLMKGAALAYTHYPSPHLRSRYDTDLLIPPSEAEATWNILRDRGYEKTHEVRGQLIFYEFLCSRRDDYGIEHILDVHWRLSNNQWFAQAFSYEELARHATGIAALGGDARALDPVHALLVALMHRSSHARYGEGNRLIWFYDIHLLARSFTEWQWEQCITLAEQKSLRGVSRDGLHLARDVFETPLPPALDHRLKTTRDERDRSAAYLDKKPWRYLIVDLRALPSWKERLTLFREHFLPPPEYMMKKYNRKSRLLLPLMYLHRTLTGIWKYL